MSSEALAKDECPDLKFERLSWVQHRGVKPLLQFRPNGKSLGLLLHTP